MKVVIEKTVNTERWDRLVAGASGGHIFQSATWAAYEREYLGIRSCFFTLEDRDSGRPLALMRAGLESPFNRFFFEKPLRSITVPLVDRLSTELSVRYGPLHLGSPTMQQKAEMLKLLLEAVENYSRDHGVVTLKGVFSSIYDTQGEEEQDFVLSEILDDRRYGASQEATFIVDLSPDEETLWRNLKQSARKSIRRAQEQGIRVERIKYESELRPYYDFFCQCRRSVGLRSTSVRNFTEMWRILRPAEMLEVFYASHDSELLGGLGIWQHAGVLFEWGSVQSEKARREKLYCSDLLKWEVMRWGHTQGHKLYDLAGVEPDPQRADPKKRGIYQFKAKWGGKFQSFNNYSIPVKPTRERILHACLKLARKFRS